MAQVVSAFRAAVEALDDDEAAAAVAERLAALSEGGRQTAGAYQKVWR